jgi:hypothetical protein
MENKETNEKKCMKCHVKNCPMDEYCNAPIKEYCPSLIHDELTPVVEKSGWEEDFDKLLPLSVIPVEAWAYLKDFIKNVEKEAYERGQGKMVIDWGVKELENARLEGKKEAVEEMLSELSLNGYDSGSGTIVRDFLNNYKNNL